MTLQGPITLGKQPSRTILRPVAIHVIQMTVALLVCLSGLRQATTIWAQGTVTIRLDPMSLEIGAGNTDTVDILVENVTDLYGFEFEITFDPAMVEVVDADPDEEGVQIQSGDFLSPDWTLENTVDNDNGTIAYALCQMNPSPPQSGGGVLAIITWRGKAPGTSSLHLAHVLLAATRGVEIPASAEDGQIVVVSTQAPPADTPTPTAAPTGTPAPPPPTSTPISTPVPPTPTPTATPIPPTFTPPATAALETTDPPAVTPTPVPPSTATPTDVPMPTSTSLPTATPAREGTGTPPPTMIVIQPTSTAVSVAAAQPEPTEQAASPTPSPSTPNPPSGSSGIPTSSLMYIAIACVVTALGAWAFAWVLWRRNL